MNGRKKWQANNEIPQSLKQDSEEEYYSDSFESYSSENSKANIMAEILKKLTQVPMHQMDRVIEYVASISEYKKIR